MHDYERMAITKYALPAGIGPSVWFVTALDTVPASANCNDLDFNNDGLEQDPTDIEAFLSVYSGGPCA